MGKRRLDALLAERGLFPSRSRAAASVMAGEVRVGVGERRAQKPGELIDDGEELHVEQRPEYVSRGGIKLANALDATGLELAGRRALDVGASTGGFTDCLLQRGVTSCHRSRRRLRHAFVESAQRPPRDGARAHERPRARAADAALRS